MTRFFLYLFFTLSGAVALVYEALWSRYLKLFLGHSSYGQIVTLIMFMGGIGLGSFLAARYLKKVKNPFLVYARIEMVAAVFGFGFHLAYESMTKWFFGAAAGMQEIAPWFASTVQIGICVLLTLPFATLLGTTFPLLAAGMIRTFPDGGKRSLPLLYFANSLGGAIGILLCSYFLISAFGTKGALYVASLGNVVVAVGFFVIHRNLKKQPVVAIPEKKVTETAGPSDIRSNQSPQVGLWLFVAAGTGLASFIYEVGWIRLLSLILGSSTHSFDAMISAFILGLAFGGLFVRRLLDRVSGNLAPVLGTIQILMGSLAALSLYLYQPFFDAVQASHSLLAKTESAFPLHSIFKYLLCLGLMFPAAFCAGMTLPLITWRLVKRTGRENYTGLVYGWNTLGSIVGAALAGLFLMPVIQLKWTIFTGAALDIALGLALLFFGFKASKKQKGIDGPSKSRIHLLRFGAVTVVAVALLPAFWTSFDPAVISSGKFRNGRGDEHEVEAIRHGKTATIAVVKSGAVRSIATNGKSDGALLTENLDRYSWRDVDDEGTVAMLAGLPMLTRDGEYDAALIGMGTGMTGHYLLTDSRLKSLDLIEIEEAVIELSKKFSSRNERLWTDERLNIVIDDAKRYFYSNRKQYDIIISEPSNPWVSGVSGLFTKEFYEHTKHFLKPGGVLVQWVHGYEFSDELMVSIFSALNTFEHFEIYRVPDNNGDYIVVAGDEELSFISPEKLAAVSEFDEDLSIVGAKIAEFGPGNFLASERTLRPNLNEFKALTNSDYFPYVEQNAEVAFFTSNRVNLPHAFMDSFHGWADLTDQKRSQEARRQRAEFYVESEGFNSGVDETTVKRLNGLLANPKADADWLHIEQLLLTATHRTTATPLWLQEPTVQKMRSVLASETAPLEYKLRFEFLASLSENNWETVAKTLPKAVQTADAEILQTPYWLRTFLSTALRLNDNDTINFLTRESVGKCGTLSADERALLTGYVLEQKMNLASSTLIEDE